MVKKQAKNWWKNLITQQKVILATAMIAYLAMLVYFFFKLNLFICYTFGQAFWRTSIFLLLLYYGEYAIKRFALKTFKRKSKVSA